MNQRGVVTLIALACLATPLGASGLDPRPTETIDDYISRLGGASDTQKQAAVQVVAKEKTANANALAPSKVKAKPTSTAVPQGFADRVSDSMADFLPFFQTCRDSVDREV